MAAQPSLADSGPYVKQALAIFRFLRDAAKRCEPGEHDPQSAVVTLFHDHDRETALLLQACEQKPFLIGAMGSRRTYRERSHAIRRHLPSPSHDRTLADRALNEFSSLHQ